MARRSTSSLAAVILAVLGLGVLGPAACGGDDDAEAYKDDFPQLSERLVSLGQEVGEAIESAGQSTDADLAAEFERFSEEVGELRQELEDLEPPEELADEQEALAAAIGDVRESLAGIADAAEAGDPEAARAATEELVQGSAELRDARRALADAVREL